MNKYQSEAQNTPRAAFAKRFKEEMERKGLKSAEAQLQSLVDAGILKAEAKPSTIRNYWNERTWPDVNNLIKLADFFGVSLDYLTGRSDVKTINADIAIASKTTGLSEDTIDGLVLMKKAYPSGTAALNALLIDSMGKRENKVEAIGGFLTTLSRYFETTIESDKITDGWVSNEADKNQKLARLDLWVFMSNLLEFGHGGDKMLRLYTDKLNELTKKGCSDNGNSKTDDH